MHSLDTPLECGPTHTPEALVVLFHGYGSNGSNLLPIAKILAQNHPRILFWTPNGIQPHEAEGDRQWFSLQGFDLNFPILSANLEQALTSAASMVSTQIDQKLATLQNANIPLILGGFSQGASLALHMGLYTRPVAGVLSFSGFYATSALPQPQYHPPIFWGHGSEDWVVPIDCMRQSTAYLRSLGLSVDVLEVEAAKHEIPMPMIERAEHWISQWKSSLQT